jgi:hypothetical protein
MTRTDHHRARRLLALAAMIGVAIYVIVDVVLQFLLPHYSAISEAESNLGVGPFGWIMNINFFGRAIMTACTIGALALTGPRTVLRTIGLGLLAVAGVCSGALAFFLTDIQGPGDNGVQTTTFAGAVHVTLATTGFLFALCAFAVLTVWIVRSPALRSAVLMRRGSVLLLGVGAVGLVALGSSILWAPGLLGLAERVSLAGILGWAFTVCAGIRRLR